MNTSTQDRPLRFACDGIPDRQAQIVARIGDFVILEGMAMDSGSWFTMGPGAVPGRYNSKQEALDYIKYAQDAELFPGSSKASKEGQELYRKMSSQAHKQDNKNAPKDRQKSGFSQSDLEGYDADPDPDGSKSREVIRAFKAKQISRQEADAKLRKLGYSVSSRAAELME